MRCVGKKKKSFSLPAKPMREVMPKAVTDKVTWWLKKSVLVDVVMYVVDNAWYLLLFRCREGVVISCYVVVHSENLKSLATCLEALHKSLNLYCQQLTFLGVLSDLECLAIRLQLDQDGGNGLVCCRD